jgi:hypothetical protein
MDEDFLLERSVDDDGQSSGRKKTRFELDLEKYGSVDAVRTAKTDTEEEVGVSMARRRGGAAAVNAALSKPSKGFDGQTDPDEDFDDYFSKYILTAHDPINPADVRKEERSEEGSDDISGFRFDDDSSENEAWAGKPQKSHVDFSALAEEVIDEEALIALGKSIKLGKKEDEKQPEKAGGYSYDSEEEFSPESMVNTLSDRFAPFEFEPVSTQTEVIVYEKPAPKANDEVVNSSPQEADESAFDSSSGDASEKTAPEAEKKPIINPNVFADLAEAAAAAEAAAVAETGGGMDTAPSVQVDDNTVFPKEPPISVNYKDKETAPASRSEQGLTEEAKKSIPKTAREIANEKLAAGTARSTTAEAVRASADAVAAAAAAEAAEKAVRKEAAADSSVKASSQTAQVSAPSPQPTVGTAPRKEILSLHELSTGFNDAEYEKQTGTLPVLGELTDEFTGGKRISGKSTRTDDQIQLMRKQAAAAMNILSEDSSEAGLVHKERIIYDLHEKNEKKKRLVGGILFLSANALLFVIAAIGIFFFEGDNSGLAFLFRATIGVGVVSFIPFKFIQKLIAPFMIILALLYVVLGLAGQDPIAANITFYTCGTVIGLFGFAIRFFFASVKSLFERRKP